MSKKVVIGLSGGVDSTISALLLKKQSYEVIGVHFSFTEDNYVDRINSIADRLGIKIIIENISNDFDIVKKHFASEYLKGRTPSPCTFCNRIIKWQKLTELADKYNCEFISSGHYIRKINYNGFFHLQKGIDSIKDQSYFMWELDSQTIQRMTNPLGNFTKQEVKQIAIENGFSDLAKGKESMGVCFLQNTDYRQFLINYIPAEVAKIKSGIIRDEEQKIIGSHNGYIYYTVGQKRDLHLNKTREAYVSKIDPENNEITIGTKSSLLHKNIQLKHISLVNPKALGTTSKVMVNIRGYGLNPQEPATINSIGTGLIELKLESPAWAVAPGQPVVFYEKDIVLGGGIAEKSW